MAKRNQERPRKSRPLWCSVHYILGYLFSTNFITTNLHIGLSLSFTSNIFSRV